MLDNVMSVDINPDVLFQIVSATSQTSLPEMACLRNRFGNIISHRLDFPWIESRCPHLPPSELLSFGICQIEDFLIQTLTIDCIKHAIREVISSIDQDVLAL